MRLKFTNRYLFEKLIARANFITRYFEHVSIDANPKRQLVIFTFTELPCFIASRKVAQKTRDLLSLIGLSRLVRSNLNLSYTFNLANYPALFHI